MGLLSWWHRKVTVERAAAAYPLVTRITIDPADGSKPQELLVSRNNLCTLAWACRKMHVEEYERGPIRSVSLTLDIPQGGPDGEDEHHVLLVPDWAKEKLYNAIQRRASLLGWRGEFYRPTSTTWERLLRDDGLD